MGAPMHGLNKGVYFILLSVIALSGCKPPEEEPPVFDFKNYPGIAVIGNDEITVVYSDDERTFKDGMPVQGGIRDYYFRDNTVSYIRGSSLTIFFNDSPIAENRDTFGLDPFFSPYRIIESEKFTARSQIFVTGEGITAQQVALRASDDIDMFLRWTVYTPLEIEAGTQIRLTGTDIMEDGIYHRYDNGVIIALASYDEHSQYHFDTANEVTTVTTPLRIGAGADTTVGFFVASGESDMEVITKMFAVVETDLFDDADRYWRHWLENKGFPEFQVQQYEMSYKANLYTAYASNVRGEIPPQIEQYTVDYRDTGTDIVLSEITENALFYAKSGDRHRAYRLVHETIEHTNSYGLIPGGIHTRDQQYIFQPLSIVNCKKISEALAIYFTKTDL